MNFNFEEWAEAQDRFILENYNNAFRPKTFSPPRDNPPPTCEELLRIADEMSGRHTMRFAR